MVIQAMSTGQLREKDDREHIDSVEEVSEWERKAIRGEIEPGTYDLDVSSVECEVKPNSDRGRETGGRTVDHGFQDIGSVARVLDEEPSGWTDQLEEFSNYLDEEYGERDFLKSEEASEYDRIAVRRSNDRILMRACYID